MLKFINAFTHTEMWVADERKDEYLDAGHALASDALPVAKEPEEVPVKVEKKPSTKATTAKKATTKKR